MPRVAIMALPFLSCALVQSTLPASVAGGSSGGDVIETSLPDARTVSIGVLQRWFDANCR